MTTTDSAVARYLEFARVCKAVYPGPCNQWLLHQNGMSYSHQKYVHGSFGRGYCRIFWNKNAVTVAFRGTREWVDWIVSNLRMYPARLRDCGDKAGDIRVHRGFQNTLDYLDRTTRERSLDAALDHIKKNKLLDHPLFITGHSLGGALGILFAVKYRARFSTEHIREIVTFGSPAVGGACFHEFYGELHDRTARIVNRSDVVPFTPPIGYRHVGRDLWIGNGRPQSNIRWTKRLRFALGLGDFSLLRSDHSMTSYIDALDETLKAIHEVRDQAG